MASPWFEDVLYSPDPPFLFGGGSGNETNGMGDNYTNNVIIAFKILISKC